MRKSWLVILAMTVYGGGLIATEFRTPLIGERGPMRYIFEEWEEEDYGLKTWCAGYNREAHKAFLDHGTDTCNLSALYFGQSCFTLDKILPNSYAPLGTQYYSPYLGVVKMCPEITYEERGISIGGRFAYPVYKNKGRIGLRGRVTFKKIEIEREDTGDETDDPLNEFLTGEVVTRESTSEAPATDVFARAVRMDFLQTIPYTAPGNPILEFNSNGAAFIVGNDAKWQLPEEDDRLAVVIQAPAGTRPSSPDRLLGIHEEDPTPAPIALPAAGGVADGNQYYFNEGTNYSDLNVHAGTAAQQAAAQGRTSDLWLTSVHAQNTNGGEGFSVGSNKLWTVLDLALKNYQENIYSWLLDRGYEFESDTRSGIGDTDIDLFYEHQFTDDFFGEAFIGVRIPTAGANVKCCDTACDPCCELYNPYRPKLGNGGHWEIRLGGLLAWQPWSWMNVKLDGYWAFVLEAKEDMPAAFEGACVKNIGPCTTADVSWDYFVGNVDFNFFHPKTDAISGLLGYQFYYKTKDKIDFGCTQLESWLGNAYNETTETWDENLQTLSSKVAERRTKGIAHRVRFEKSIRITRWFELFCGGAYTFAGKNVPRELDMHLGCVITF